MSKTQNGLLFFESVVQYYLSVKLVELDPHVRPDLLHRDAQVVLNVRQELEVLVPDAAAALRELSLVAVAAPLAVVPDLLVTPFPPKSMYVLPFRQTR